MCEPDSIWENIAKYSKKISSCIEMKRNEDVNVYVN